MFKTRSAFPNRNGRPGNSTRQKFRGGYGCRLLDVAAWPLLFLFLAHWPAAAPVLVLRTVAMAPVPPPHPLWRPDDRSGQCNQFAQPML